MAEAIGQEATFRMAIPEYESDSALHVSNFIRSQSLDPSPCPSAPKEDGDKQKSNIENTCKTSTKICNVAASEPICNCCANCSAQFSNKLQLIADALNNGSLTSKSSTNSGSSVEDLMAVITDRRP